jgi:diaminopimelate decarboxylase
MWYRLSAILPDTAVVSKDNHLIVGGCDMVGLAQEFGTPLYVFDEATLRHSCARFREEFGSRYPDTLVLYAAKAFLNRTLAQIFEEEGLGLDVVSGGELAIAESVDFPLSKVYFHGNNKSREELELALIWGVGRVVVDNLYELSLLNEVAERMGISQDILLRLAPGIEPHTHRYLATGAIDTKFGFPIAQGEEVLRRAIEASHLNPVGLHIHLGSLIHNVEAYQEGVEAVLRFAVEMKDKLGFELVEFSPGGGFAIPYIIDDEVPSIADYAEAITSTLLGMAKELSLSLPKLVVEPGRAIVGRAGVALYTVGVKKEIPGIRRYVFIDGGMGDNIRPALYGSRYEAMLANRVQDEGLQRVTIAGKFCEAGDILIRDIDLPQPMPGDVIAVPVSGAYCLPQASNYNASLKPAIVMVKDGKGRLIRRRETYEDLMRCDLIHVAGNWAG